MKFGGINFGGSGKNLNWAVRNFGGLKIYFIFGGFLVKPPNLTKFLPQKFLFF